jgi:hypothetical protein
MKTNTRNAPTIATSQHEIDGKRLKIDTSKPQSVWKKTKNVCSLMVTWRTT